MTRLKVLLAAAGLLLLVSRVDSSVFVGGKEPAKLDEDGVVRAAHFATQEMNSMSNSMFAHKVTDIVKAEKQVVAGVKYFLTIEVSETECKNNKGPVEDLGSCQVREGKPKAQICEVTVLEVAWQHSSELLDFSCGKEENKKQN